VAGQAIGSSTADVRWAAARELLDGLPDGGVNMAHEAVERHVQAGHGAATAIRWRDKDGARHPIRYDDLLRDLRAFAGVLAGLGGGEGVRVFTLLGRVPELYATVLGTLYAGGVAAPLFAAFGPEPVRQRVDIGAGEVLVTTRRLYERRVAPVRDQLPSLRHVLLVDARADLPAGTASWHELVERAAPRTQPAATGEEDLALLHFTSGTTGTPKGAMHVHGAILQHLVTARTALDLRAGDVFWCTADPGWVTGTSYGILAPLANGVTMVVDEAEFDPGRWYGILEDERVTVWYTAPTAIRMLMKAGAELVDGVDLAALRFMASVGEPLNPEAVVWSREVLGRPFHDNWWQTETGGIMIANTPGMAVKPGSMGKPLPGVEAAVVKRRDGRVTVLDEPDAVGELALRPGWPSMFRGYLGQEERYRQSFADGWYLSGDLARRDADGYFWFVGRSDDVIKSAGHLIGPFEVESALMAHPAVAEVGVVGLPDERVGEAVKAFVAVKDGVVADERLARDLLAHARKRLGPAVAPREVAFRTNLPKTRSGKIMRRLLRARELGLPEGDLSTLESDEAR
jgi:acetyl-CoA synthetase